MATKNIVPNDNGEGGIGVTGKRWNTGFINTITGNLTGDVTGNVSGTAATVTGAAQSNITSLGTLTGLTLSGDVKIGTSTTVTPATQADDIVIDKGASESGITIVSTAAASLRFGDAGSSSVGFIEYNHSSNDFRLGTNGGTKLQIANTGELIYNSGGFIDFDGQSLQLNTQRNPNSGVFNDTSKSNASIGLNGASGGSSIIFKTAAGNNTTATTRLTISSGGNTTFHSDARFEGDLYPIKNNGFIYFGSNSTARIQHISSSNSLAINPNGGNVGIGTASPTAKLNVVDSASGGAIKISGAVTDSSASYYGFMHDGTDLQGATQVNLFYAGGAIKTGATIADFASFRIDAPSIGGGGITNNYGIYQASSAQKNYFGGNVGIGVAPGGSDRFSVKSGGNSSSTFNTVLTNSSNTTLFTLRDDGAATFGGSVSAVRLFSASGGNKTNPMIAPSDDQDTGIFFPSANTMAFSAGNTETFRITSGNLIVGATSDVTGTHYFNKAVSADGGILFVGSSTTGRFSLVVNGSDIGYNDSPDTCLKVGGTSSTSRSISAAGTVNVSGNDYAEYMTKAITEDISKGDVVGVNSDGLLTNIFNDAISFVIKSTDPSFVGGDIWGIESKDKDKIEEARIKVDRIAFSGQVPCNVKGASVGDYIIPVASSDGKITGQAVSNPTFEQYKISVGKVWKIMNNGNSWVAVKIV